MDRDKQFAVEVLAPHLKHPGARIHLEDGDMRSLVEISQSVLNFKKLLQEAGFLIVENYKPRIPVSLRRIGWPVLHGEEVRKIATAPQLLHRDIIGEMKANGTVNVSSQQVISLRFPTGGVPDDFVRDSYTVLGSRKPLEQEMRSFLGTDDLDQPVESEKLYDLHDHLLDKNLVYRHRLRANQVLAVDNVRMLHGQCPIDRSSRPVSRLARGMYWWKRTHLVLSGK